MQPQKGGAIAQLVEQRTENPCVPSSILGGTTNAESKKKKLPKVADFDYVDSTNSGVFVFREKFIILLIFLAQKRQNVVTL